MSQAARRAHETDSEEEVEALTPPRKSIKSGSTKSSKQKFRRSYAQLWPCLGPSAKGESFVRCRVCAKDFSCAHGGQNDCRKHVLTSSHKEIVSRAASSGSVAKFFVRSESDSQTTLQRQTTAAEVIMCEMIAELNLPLTTADNLTKAFKHMFPDSTIAKVCAMQMEERCFNPEMKCSRNKTTAVIKEVARSVKDSLIVRMKSQPYTLSTDGSNDSASKQFPIVVRCFNTDTGQVTSELLSLAICKGPASGENIFKLLDAELKSSRIDWQQCLALGCDNANVMVGQHKGVFAFVKREQPAVFLAGCTLHTIHNGAKKAASECLPSFEEVLTDIYYYFQKSSSRLEKFKGDQDFCGIEERKMLKHVCTRWLSISRCLSRMLSNWDALKVFFHKEKQELGTAGTDSYAGKKVESVYAFVRSPTNRLFAHFLVYVHSILERVLVAFQAEEPKIHLLERSLQKLVRSIFECYLKPSALKGKSLHEVHFMQGYSVKANESIIIGDGAEAFLRCKEENHLRDERIAEFYKAVKEYFQVLSKYFLDKLPLGDILLQHAKVADPTCRTTVQDRSLKFFIDRFPCLLPKDVLRQTVLQQFASFQCLSDVEVNACTSDRIDTTWVALGSMRDETGEARFQELAAVMCGILTIPHSSAHCERVFSCVRKNRTTQRASLSDDTLESLLLLKSRPGEFGTRKYSAAELDRFKSAYYQSLTTATS